MKKLAFALVAMLALVFTGCKTETSEITVYVEDASELPVAQRQVFYADWASLIIGEVLPSPEELISGGSDVWDVAITNQLGVATIKIPLSVGSMRYQFMVYDYGTRGWKEQTVNLQRGKNEELTFKVTN
jgi:hypothetical protein